MLRHLLSSTRRAQLMGCADMSLSAPKASQEILARVQQPTASVADAARIIGRLRRNVQPSGRLHQNSAGSSSYMRADPDLDVAA
jgi:hypothetical protein